jgi:hypothetical protein
MMMAARALTLLPIATAISSLVQFEPGQGAPWWMQYIAFGPGFIALILILVFLIRMAPTWKEVKLKELDLRSQEVNVRGEEAKGLGTLGSSLGALAAVLEQIALRQREETEDVGMLQRVNIDASQKLTSVVAGLSDRLDRMDRDGSSNLQSLSVRVESLEHNVHSQTTASTGK